MYYTIVSKQCREKCRNSPSFEFGSPTQHILSWNACCGASRLPKVRSNSSLPRWWKNLRIREVSLAALPASSAYPPTKLSSRGPSRAKSYIGFYLEISCSIELTEICSSCFITAALACCFVRSVIRPLLPLPVAIWQEIQWILNFACKCDWCCFYVKKKQCCPLESKGRTDYTPCNLKKYFGWLVS